MNYGSFKEYNQRDNSAQTPAWLYDILNKEHCFDFDPCPANPTFDGLTEEWGMCNYVNPPYNNIKLWLRKAVVEMQKGKKSVFLVPLRPHCKYWRDFVVNVATEVHLVLNKIAFEGYNAVFPGNLCLIVYDPNSTKHVFKQDHGPRLATLPVAATITPKSL